VVIRGLIVERTGNNSDFGAKYGGWSCAELASVLMIAETKVSQSLDPWRRKAARLARADWPRFLRLVMYAIDELDEDERRERAPRRGAVSPAQLAELDALIDAHEGRLDRMRRIQAAR